MQEAPILNWPDLSAAALTVAVLFVLAGFAIFALTRFYYRRQAATEARWKALADYALKRKVNQRELDRLHRFFQNLSESEQNEALHSRRRLHALLHEHLVRESAWPARERVTLFDKLFPPVQADEAIEIKSERDLQPGETVALEWSGGRFLGAVVKRTEEGELWISIPESAPRGGLQGMDAQVFAYRPGLGGFALQGRINRAGKEGVAFQPGGTVESLGEQHLMALLDLPTRLEPWEPDEPAQGRRDSIGARNPAEAGVETPSPYMEGRAERISDRGLLFLPEEGARDAAERLFPLHEIWQAEFTLPDGFVLRCRGRIVRAHAPGRYVFRYTDLPDNARRILWDAIKRNNPRRERLA